MIKIEKNKVLVQIGTNDGHDWFNRIVKESVPTKVILVEPNKLLNDHIYNNYAGVANVFLENVAITRTREYSVKLVIPKALFPKRKSMNGVVYKSGHYSLLPMDDWGNDFESFEARGITFTDLCEKHKIKDIHFLQIDTEGYDAEIIKSIDFDKVNIDIIKYESWGFPESCFTRYGDDSKLYGINGMNFVKNHLESLGYEITQEAGDVIAIKK